MCGLGCMIERENEYDCNASELDLSATSSPLKLKAREKMIMNGLHTARPFDQRAQSPISLGSMERNMVPRCPQYAPALRYPLAAGPGSSPSFTDNMPSQPYHQTGPMPVDPGVVGGESVVTVINLRRAHSPYKASSRPISPAQQPGQNIFNNRMQSCHHSPQKSPSKFQVKSMRQ